MFNKPVTELEFSDIDRLKNDETEESEILDYKEVIKEENLLKEVVAFSNGRGGYLIYGIKESGRKGNNRGSYPEAIIGIDKSFNCDRLEHLIIGNVMPRVSVQFQKIPIPDTDNMILVVYVPEGQNKPYYNNDGNRYFKRYNFAAVPMLEHEIEAMYRERFFGVSNLYRYVNEAVSFNRNFISVDERSKVMDCHIIVSPLRVEDRIIDTTDSIGRELRDLFPKDFFSLEYLYGLGKPSKYGIKWAHSSVSSIVEVHRNGLVYCMGTCSNIEFQFSEVDFLHYLLNTISFATIVYSKFNYLGKVKIIARILNCANSEFRTSSYLLLRREPYKCDAEEITVEREWDSWKLKEDYLKIGKSVVDEVANCYGLWESLLLIEKDGEIIKRE